MTNIELEDIFKSDDFKTCEDKLKKSEIKSYHNSDSEAEIKENREKMNELKKTRDFIQFDLSEIDKYEELPNTNNWEKFIAKYKLNTNKYKFISGNSEKLLDVFNNFYNAHPFLTPFVGENYGKVLNQKIDVLYVMESHYLPDFSEFYPEGIKKRSEKQNWLLTNWYASDWYKSTLYQEDLEYMWTESVIKYNMISNNRFTQLFRRMLSPLYSCISNNDKQIPDNELIEMINGIAFMNYYLRPAEKTGSHIMPTTLDNLISYINLLSVWEKLGKPHVIICSSLAANCFEAYAQYMSNKDGFKNDFVRCNHPGTRSWGKKISCNETVFYTPKGQSKQYNSEEIQKAFWKEVFSQEKQ